MGRRAFVRGRSASRRAIGRMAIVVRDDVSQRAACRIAKRVAAEQMELRRALELFGKPRGQNGKSHARATSLQGRAVHQLPSVQWQWRAYWPRFERGRAAIHAEGDFRVDRLSE